MTDKKKSGLPYKLTKPIKWEGSTTLEKKYLSDGYYSVLGTDIIKSELPADYSEKLRKKDFIGFKKYNQEYWTRLNLLFDHLGEDKEILKNANLDDPLIGSLLFKILPSLVSGLSISFENKKMGRSKEWNILTYSQLLASIEKIKLEKNCTDSQACRIHASKELSARLHSNKVNSYAKTLQNRLVEARDTNFNPFAKMLDMHDIFTKPPIEIIIEVFGKNSSQK